MRDRLIELICEIIQKECCITHCNNPPCCECMGIADHLLANGVIVPPCKVGQTFYYVCFGKVYKGKCHAITLKPTMQIHLYDFDGDNASVSADNVFLTKEEAEQALKERER